MSITWYPPSGWLIDVPNPGGGEMDLVDLAHPDPDKGPALVTEDWEQTLTGPKIGAFLLAVTDRAFQSDTAAPDADGELPVWLTPAAARTLLPALQQAVVYAVAGGERYDRTWPDEDEPPRAPYCVRCGQGTLYTPGALPSDWCDRHGHWPFGYRDGTTWDAAQRWHEMDVARWERRRQREAL